MSELITIVLDSQVNAQKARVVFASMQREYLVEMTASWLTKTTKVTLNLIRRAQPHGLRCDRRWVPGIIDRIYFLY